MKTNAIVRIVVFSLAILVLLGILLGVTIIKNVFVDLTNLFDNSNHIEAMERIDAHNATSDIRNIEIEWVSGNITLQKDPYAKEITIHEFSSVDSKYKMVLKQSGATLKILYCEQDVIKFPFGSDIDISKDLMITVPMDWECNKLEIDTAAAELILNDLTIQEFDFDGASGVCKINNCNINKIDIDTASGDVYFTGKLETLECDAASANCDIEVFNVPRSIDLDGMSGDLELILPSDAGFICNLNTMSGSFDTDFDCKMHDDTYICGDSKCKIYINAMSGSVSILKGIK